MQHRSSSPQAGDIVFAHVPEIGGSAKGKLRPALVLDVTTRNGIAYLVVAKGTSQHLDETYRGEFAIRDEESLAASGLSKQTKFQLCSRASLPFTDAWINRKVAGRVPSSLLPNMLNAAREAGLV